MKIVVLPDERTTTAEAALHAAEADATQSWDEACTEWRPAAPSRPCGSSGSARVLYPPS